MAKVKAKLGGQLTKAGEMKCRKRKLEGGAKPEAGV